MMVMVMAHSDGADADIRLGSPIAMKLVGDSPMGNLTNIKSMMRCTSILVPSEK